VGSTRGAPARGTAASGGDSKIGAANRGGVGGYARGVRHPPIINKNGATQAQVGQELHQVDNPDCRRSNARILSYRRNNPRADHIDSERVGLGVFNRVYQHHIARARHEKAKIDQAIHQIRAADAHSDNLNFGVERSDMREFNAKKG